jgi:methylmalonyl-CoA epimerase
MPPRLAHVAVAVDDLATARRVFSELLGLSVAHEETVADQGVHTLSLDLAGGGQIELLEPTGADTPVGKFLAKRGAGLHHVALTVDDLDEMLARLVAAGVELIDPEPRTGAGGCRIAFLHPKSTAGVLVELIEDASA